MWSDCLGTVNVEIAPAAAGVGWMCPYHSVAIDTAYTTHHIHVIFCQKIDLWINNHYRYALFAFAEAMVGIEPYFIVLLFPLSIVNLWLSTRQMIRAAVTICNNQIDWHSIVQFSTPACNHFFGVNCTRQYVIIVSVDVYSWNISIARQPLTDADQFPLIDDQPNNRFTRYRVS